MKHDFASALGVFRSPETEVGNAQAGGSASARARLIHPPEQGTGGVGVAWALPRPRSVLPECT
jgi:hypothetical protein